MGRKIVNIFLALIITLFFLLPYLSLKKIETEREIQRNKVSATQRIDDISRKLTEQINMSIEYVDILDVIVRSNPSNIETIESYAKLILEKHDSIENISIAPNGVVILRKQSIKDQLSHKDLSKRFKAECLFLIARQSLRLKMVKNVFGEFVSYPLTLIN